MAIRYTCDPRSSVRSSSFYKSYLSKQNRDCFQDCVERNIWGKQKIKLLDTTFWETLTKDSGRYKGKFRKNNDILDCDFAVMPMFEK
jgi:hypothetical protein